MGNEVYEIPVNVENVLYAYLSLQNPYTLSRLKALYISELDCRNSERISNAREVLKCIEIIEENRRETNAL